MVTEVRIYFEGDRSLRPALGEFLGGLRDLARSKGVRWEVIACGSRGKTFDSFRDALVDHPDAFNVLLIDSEDPVTLAPWEHLRRRLQDCWAPPGVGDDHCHLMVEMMESWFLADVQTLKGSRSRARTPCTAGS